MAKKDEAESGEKTQIVSEFRFRSCLFENFVCGNSVKCSVSFDWNGLDVIAIY